MAMTFEDTGVTDVICFKDFLKQWMHELTEKKVGESCVKESEDLVTSFEDFAAKYMSAEVVTELNAECSPATLTCDLEPQDAMSLVSDIPPHVDLVSVQHQRVELEQRQQGSGYRCKSGDKLKNRFRDGPWKHSCVQSNDLSVNKVHDDQTSMKVAYPDILANVQIYRPYKKRKNLNLDQEFHVLGQQKLSELRDKIVCISDHVAVGDFSENPDTQCDSITKDLYKSGFFFIEGVFYNDMRDASNLDYSRNIIEWAKNSSRDVGPYQSRQMELTSFIDLNARLGQPYCYTHQGDCEHILIFTDLRVLHPEDCQILSVYPILTLKSRERRAKCRVCLMYQAKWVTWGSKLAPEDPCFFCETCFRALHYDSNGRKLVSDMKVYPIRDVKMLKK